MALIKCLGCGRSISDMARKCPGCGWVPGTIIETGAGDEKVPEADHLKDIENLKQIIVKLNNDKDMLKKQVEELALKEPVEVDKTDYALVENLRQEKEQLKREYDQLIKEKDQQLWLTQSAASGEPESLQPNHMINWKKMVVGAAGLFIAAAAVISVVCGVVIKIVVKDELSRADIMAESDADITAESDAVVYAEESEQPKAQKSLESKKKTIAVADFEPKEEGYTPGDTICEMDGVSVVYESCVIDEETTAFVFKCINNGNATYKFEVNNIAINRKMMEGDYFKTEEITSGNQGELSFWYGNEYLQEECGDFQEMNFTAVILDDYLEVNATEGVYIYP